MKSLFRAIILSRVTNDMLSSSRRNSGNLRLVLKSLVSSRIVAFGCEIMSEEKNRGVDPKGEEVFFGSHHFGERKWSQPAQDTILRMFVRSVGVGSTNNPLADLFRYLHHLSA